MSAPYFYDFENAMGDEAAWRASENINQLHEAERAALRRVAGGLATKSDAMLLAGSLHHADLFAPQEPRKPDGGWDCPYCGDEMPSGAEPTNWACCGEAGHAEER